MSKTTSYIVIFLVVIGVIGGLLFFYFRESVPTVSTGPAVIPTTENPFGTAPVNVTTSTSEITDGGQTETEVKILAKLTQIYRSPVSGSVLFLDKDKNTILRFIDRANGNVYEYSTQSKTGEAKRITNTTVQKVQEAIWSSTGENVIFRNLDNDTDNIASFSAKINLSTSTLGEISGNFLASNIKQLAISPSGSKIFELFGKESGGSTGRTATFEETNKKQIFDSPLSLWTISWPKENTIAFLTKPSYKDYGYLFFLNTQTGSFDKILGNVTGMTALVNSDANLVAYSESGGNSFILDVYDVQKKASKGFSLITLADKCVWGEKNSSILYCAIPQSISSGNYPDNWYQGLVSFSDNIWSLDTENGTTKVIYQANPDSVAVDAFDLNIGPDDEYLSFTSKNDLSLWLLDLESL